jgi:uncharacterized repeat protein (TIGR01451 family)
LNGFDTSTAQRSYGGTDGNGFGNWKGLDLWTYYPSTVIVEELDVVPVQTYDLGIVKSHKGVFEVSPGGGSYIFTVTNVGNQPVTGEVVVTDALPKGLAAASATGAGWTCGTSTDHKTVTCTHPNTGGLAADASLPVIIVSVDLTGSATTPVFNTVNVSNSSDQNPANNSFTDQADINKPTAVEMVGFTAVDKNGAVLLEWETASERDLVGFNLFRATGLKGAREQINSAMIACHEPGGLEGGVYSYEDFRVAGGQTYYYWLEFIKTGASELSEPQVVTTENRYYLPVTRR